MKENEINDVLKVIKDISHSIKLKNIKSVVIISVLIVCYFLFLYNDNNLYILYIICSFSLIPLVMIVYAMY